MSRARANQARANQMHAAAAGMGKTAGGYLELSAVEVVRAASKLLVVDVLVNIHLARVDLQDARSRLLRRVGEFDRAIKAP